MSDSWQPLLDGDLAARALEAVQAIAEDIPHVPGWIPEGVAANSQLTWRSSLASGSAGQALFYAYLSLHTGEEPQADLAIELLDRATEALAAVPMSEGLYSGFTGIAWVSDHLRGRLFEADEDANREVDEGLLTALSHTPWTGEYDLINGLVGLGVYALEGLPRPTAAECLERVVDRLAERAEETPEGLTWFNPPHTLPSHQRESHPEGLYNLGASHGVPGAIGLLGAACAAGIATAKVRPLLTGAVSWLLAQRQAPGAEFCFPHFQAPGTEPRRCRIAWCYGDPGVAATLLVAARGAGEPAWERVALETALSAAARPEETAGVQDAGLCHGATGVAHLFQRMYQMTGEERLAAAARRWFEKALDFRKPGQGVGGFQSWAAGSSSGNQAWRDDPGLLEGAAGVGLALLGAVSTVEPEWDRLFLASLPTR
jgi:lantibiotic biosynthesis protein